MKKYVLFALAAAASLSTASAQTVGSTFYGAQFDWAGMFTSALTILFGVLTIAVIPLLGGHASKGALNWVMRKVKGLTSGRG
jgi:hypothetical protein